jgi:hypothetical protein
MIGVRKKFPWGIVITSTAIAIPLYSWILYTTGSSLETIVFFAGAITLAAVVSSVIVAIIIKRNRQRG